MLYLIIKTQEIQIIKAELLYIKYQFSACSTFYLLFSVEEKPLESRKLAFLIWGSVYPSKIVNTKCIFHYKIG